MNTWYRAAALTAIASAVLVASSSASLAAVIVALPGPGTPLQDAVDSAAPGDTVQLITIDGVGARYFETVAVDKPITLRGSCVSPAEILGRCDAPIALNILSDDVSVTCVHVSGGSDTTINVDGRTHVIFDRVTASGPPPGLGCGGGRIGIRVAASTDVKVSRCSVPNPATTAAGYAGAGIQLQLIPADAKVELLRTSSAGSEVGVLIEDSTDTPEGRTGIQLTKNRIASNRIGIQLLDADGVRIDRNTVNDPLGTSPIAGIVADADSSENRLIGNTVSGSTMDVVDNGTSNCWHRTMFVTGSIPAGGCP